MRLDLERQWAEILDELEEKDGPIYRAYAEAWLGRGLLVDEVRRELGVDTDDGRRIQDVIRWRIDRRCD